MDFLKYKIEFGDISHKNVADTMSDAQLTIVPSRDEVYGIIVAEAIWCGSLVVANNFGGIPEVIQLAQSELNEIEISILNQWVKSGQQLWWSTRLGKLYY